MSGPCTIANAPGLTWKRRRTGWEARWQARGDLVKRGYETKSVRCWSGEMPDEADQAIISSICRRNQDLMLAWARGGVTLAPKSDFDGTLKGLIRCYRTHEHSGYQKLRYRSRVQYDKFLSIIDRDCGEVLVGPVYVPRKLADIRASDVLDWHKAWSGGGEHVSMGHYAVGVLRTIIYFGEAVMEEEDLKHGGHCARLASKIKRHRIKNGKPRTVHLTTEHVMAIRAKAHEMGYPMVALAQAIQFECAFRQKDVIGEWMPHSEPILSDVIHGQWKWARGIRWEEIDASMVLKHVTSKRQKLVTINLRLALMALEEFAHLGFNGDRASLPAKGPIILDGTMPFHDEHFRHRWRQIATAAGVPKDVRNMDSRSGRITQAVAAGASLEAVKKLATHSDITMTQRYERGDDAQIEDVMRKCNALRERKANQ
jgi:hypothetical protein